MGMKQKKNQTGRLKKLRFSTPPILNFFFQKYQGLVRLIDVKDIDMAQPIWLRDCGIFFVFLG